MLQPIDLRPAEELCATMDSGEEEAANGGKKKWKHMHSPQSDIA